jgi:cytochrome c7-like protein/class III cytochrome C family protein
MATVTMRWGVGILCAGIVMGQGLPDTKVARAAPAQPIAYSHKVHAGDLKLACAQCHPVPGDGEAATLPPTAKCMACHETIKKDSPEIAKLAAAHAAGKALEWARVYLIPDYVSFSHRKHLASEGVSCENCHGPVKEREVMRREKDLSMGSCIECHRAKAASVDCTACHDQR